MSLPAALVLVFVILLYLCTAFKVCEEDKRLVIHRLGRLMPLRGPGLVVVMPSIEKAVKIQIGDRGEVVDEESAKIKEVLVAVKSSQRLNTGSIVKITGFGGSQMNGHAKVELDADQRKKIRCEKCGHLMPV